jgi:hypothetical protein
VHHPRLQQLLALPDGDTYLETVALLHGALLHGFNQAQLAAEQSTRRTTSTSSSSSSGNTAGGKVVDVASASTAAAGSSSGNKLSDNGLVAAVLL